MGRQPSRLAKWGLWIAVAALVVLAVCVIGNRTELIHFGIAVRGLALAAALGLVGVVVSAAGIIRTMTSNRSGARLAIAGLVLGLLVAAPVVQAILAGSQVPGIHDITTDLDNPPSFDAVVALRGEGSNPLDRAAPEDLAALQAQAYPDITTIMLAEQPGRVFEAAVETARDLGWAIVAMNPETGLIEATATTRVMNFRDDVAIRVTERGDGAAVDIRSVSRVGISDLGANANRIRTFRDALKKELAAGQASR
ncbi:DUF1499 domain-containing protein [uncultured Parvibaculum sp.]|uniref:DUF1499 domain-containing protein n=1 Tax=uncultured Parvibaculum sp. TaxID=291828 RepID=UPI0030DAADD3|tara:strand:+ start:32581 stop:33339 length:759 start_codon:yes stop_codon:yes gene_type:complete